MTICRKSATGLVSADESQVIEVASNDGYLLQYFKEQDIPVLDSDPAQNVTKVAEEKGIPSDLRFFGFEAAHDRVLRNRQADFFVVPIPEDRVED